MKLINSDCIIAMKEMPDNSVDSIVTDPPYELGFMGKSWDSTGIANSVEMWSQALRVLKPGGHLIAFSGSRTYHRMAVAIEDAGFEIRDQIMWVYGSGFPKSHNISKAIDKAGSEGGWKNNAYGGGNSKCETCGKWIISGSPCQCPKEKVEYTTPEAQQWEGWGTALKPAHEPMVLARKPLVGTVANNVLTYGVGGLNIDASRVGRVDGDVSKGGYGNGGIGVGAVGEGNGEGQNAEWIESTQGRFPANFIHDGSDEVVELFPILHGSGNKSDTGDGQDKDYEASSYQISYAGRANRDYGSKGGSAARFFYCAKTSKRDRNEGLEGFEEKAKVFNGQSDKPSGNAKGSVEDKFSTQPSANNHPTVKPTELMRYLVRMITPPEGTVLDPFMGSGSTGKACAYEGFDFIGIDQSAEYVEIARARIEFALHQEDTKEMELPF
jgi:site-specific DNA-methyltransferase (adenine-specific)